MKNILLFPFALFASINTLAQLPYFGLTNFDQTNELQLTMDSTDQNIWQIGHPDKIVFTQAYSNPNEIMTDSLNPYPVNNESSFQILLPYAFVGFGSAITFHHRINTTLGHDGGYVEFSHDHGVTWYNVLKDSAFLQQGGEIFLNNFYTNADTLADGTPAFSGDTSGSWQESEIVFGFLCVLRDFADTINVRFVFKSDSSFDNLDGWEIDDIDVAEYVCSDVAEIMSGNFDFTIFPNPATDQISLLTKGMLSPGKIFIRDQMGRIMLESNAPGGLKEYPMDIHMLPAGIFEADILTDKGYYSRKFIKAVN